jgi:hypothetical protein
MPWEIKRNYSGCSGYAVVKKPDGELEGCHSSRDAAMSQMRALYASEGEMGKSEHGMDHENPSNPEWHGQDLYDTLPQDEKELADALLDLSDKVGPLDKAEGIWVGYVGPEGNDNLSIGIKCGNCALHKNENQCAILSMPIEMDGNCRFAVIPQQLVNTENISEEDMEDNLTMKADSVRVGQMVSWNSSGGRAQGRVLRVVRNGKIKVPDSSFEITGTPDNPAVAIRVYRDGEPTDRTVGHRMSTLRVMSKEHGGEITNEDTPNKYPEGISASANYDDDMSKRSLEDLDLRPTESMANNARRGLELRREFGRGGTAVGVARARDLANRKDLSPETVGRMYSFFSRHEVDKKGKDFNNPERPSNGKIAWLLWGGDSGYAWARSKWSAIQRIRGNKMDKVWQDSALSLRKYVDENDTFKYNID